MRHTLAACVAAALIAGVPAAGLAAGGGGGGGSTPTCKSGYVYSSLHKKCIKQRSGAVPDRDLLDQAWALADDGRYDAAIALFKLVRDNALAEKYNGLGYSYRKLGRLDLGIRYYNTALMIDPGYLLARNYLAKGYLAAGRYEQAAEQLAEIAARCRGSDCELRDDLRIAMAAYRPDGGN